MTIINKRTDEKSFSNETITVSNSISISDSSVSTTNRQFLPKVPIMSHKKTKSYHDEFKKNKLLKWLQIVKPLEDEVFNT